MPTYQVVPGSNSGHCCFEASVVSDDRPSLRQDKSVAESPEGVPQLDSICECFERQDADMICTALNNAETPILQALQAWHAAWKLQGDDRVLAMVEAERLTCRALGLEENT